MPPLRLTLLAVILCWLGHPLSILSAPPLDPAGVWLERPAGRPVIDRGPNGAWDHYAVDNPFLLLEGDKLYCFYEGQDKPFRNGGHERVGLAVSDDGLHWRKCDANPILDVGPHGAWDSEVAKIPCVTKHAGQYWLFYTGRATAGGTMHIGLATSSDLRRWQKVPEPVLRSRPDRWDRVLSTHAAPVLRVGGRFLLLYRGMLRRYAAQGVGLAASTDLKHWRRAREEPVIGPDNEIYSLAVARSAGRFIAIAQSPGRRYWFSRDLVHWRSGPQARFSGPHVETVSNPVFFRGRWIVLYEQRDRIYRAELSAATR